MQVFQLSNPQAAAAVKLAHAAQYMPRAQVTRILETGEIPRALYVLACVLRAAGNVHTVKN